jgi:hypothetical protein
MRIRNLLPAVQRPDKSDVDHPFYSLQRQMNSLFDDFFPGSIWRRVRLEPADSLLSFRLST